MAWVHLASYPIGMPDAAALWIGEYTRFAAGFFVMLAGLTVRLAFGVGLASRSAPLRRATVLRLLRRASLLLFVDRLAGVVFAATESLLRTGPGPSLDPDRLLAIATFQQPGATGGLLVLYTMLLALTVPLERLRAAVGGPAVLAASLSIFALAQWTGTAAHWPPWTFPLAHWQPLFVVGYLATPHLGRLQDASGGVTARRLALATAGVAAVFVLRNGHALGMADGLLPAFVFRKVPLNAAELAWYATASAFVLLAASRLFEGSAWVRSHTVWLQRLGRWSLVAYVAHLLLELPIVAVVTWLDPSPALRATSLVVIVVALDAVARAAEAVKARRAAGVPSFRAQAMMRRLVPAGGVVGAAVATLCAAVVLATPAPRWALERHAAEKRETDVAAHDFVEEFTDASFLDRHLDDYVTTFDAELEGPDLGNEGDVQPAPDAPQIDDAGFETAPQPNDDDEAPTTTMPFGDGPIEELIDDELEPVAN